jgi:phosphodiesterase/alkaline phosphatase D-like protein
LPRLVLGPVLRYVDERRATLWVQTDAPCAVEVLGAREQTWCVDGLHFALVTVEGLAPGTDHPYTVTLDGEQVWPEAGSRWPQSAIRPLAADRPADVVFGSCRITRPHEPPYVLRAEEHPAGQGIDALRAYALRCATDPTNKPDMLLMLGDQIYADEPSPALKETLAARDRPAGAPADELADFCDYALAYEEAWSDPAIRWLLSTVPLTTVFDDHEIHAEWRISQGWLDEMNAEPWFDAHIRAGLVAYWVFQHIGNLAPEDLRAGELYDKVRAADDAGALLAVAMDTEGRQTGHSRWSFARDVGDARLVVIDSRAGRDVTPGARELIRDDEWAWVREQVTRPARHLLLASSVPFLLAPGLHHAEAFDEALADGAWGGRVGAWAGEKLRRVAVMDHWASFQRTFHRLADLLDDVSHGRCGPAPASIVMLSGDVHHCYLAEVGFQHGTGDHSPIWQAVCSAFRKELKPHEQRILALGHTALGERLARGAARAIGIPPLPLDWRVVDRPTYANQVGTLSLDGDRARLSVEAVVDGTWPAPELAVAFARDLS